jgi:hypothetical protein
MRTGLSPLLFAVTQADPHAPASPFWPLLRGADLTARVLTAEHFEAMSEILDACRGLVDSVVLLKGISIAEQYYPVPYYRPMRDIDFLVAEADLPTVESLLGKLGYFQPQKISISPGSGRHHSSPFFHSRRGIWIEVHWGLFSSLSIFATDPLFHPDHVATQLRLSTFQGRPVTRLSAELQLVYIAAHWHHQYNILAVEGAMIAMVDLLYLLESCKSTLHWEQILEGVHGHCSQDRRVAQGRDLTGENDSAIAPIREGGRDGSRVCAGDLEPGTVGGSSAEFMAVGSRSFIFAVGVYPASRAGIREGD